MASSSPVAERRPPGGLRAKAARGTLVNATFLVGLSALGLVRGLVLAGLLTVEDYGLWGILITSFGTLLWLKQAGISDRYVAQDEADQELAFQRAFTVEAVWTAVFTLVIAATVPLVALAYDEPRLIAPGLAGLAALPALALQAPLWIHYREMAFAKQRLLQSADPIVGFVVGVGLALAGAGVWAFVGGLTAGAWAGALAAVLASPYRLRLRPSRALLREYAAFSWPIVLAGAAGIVIAQGAIVASTVWGGVAAAGAITLAVTVTQFTDRVDQVVTGTLYPALARVRDRLDLLHEGFVTANRLALIWAAPFGLGVALFSGDLVRLGIGERWAPAVPVLQWLGVVAALNHVGFNWQAVFRARGETRPLAVAALVSVAAFAVATVPLLFAFGLEGFAAGLGVQTVAVLVVRWWFLRRVFPGRDVLWHAVAALVPAAGAAALVLAARLRGGERGGGEVLLEVVAFLVLTALLTWRTQRVLLRDVVGLLRAGK